MVDVVWDVSPTTQSVVINTDVTITTTWSGGVGTAQDFTYTQPSGSAGTFTPASHSGATSPRTFQYKNATPGFYTIVITPGVGPLSSEAPKTVGVVVTATAMTLSYSAVPSSNGPGQWIGNGYCVLGLDGFDSGGTKRPTQFSSWITPNGNGQWVRHNQFGLPTWTVSQPVWQVSGMVRLTSGTLVSLLYSTDNQRTYGARSRDKGKTWEISPSYTESVPALEVPPCLTVLGDSCIACWADGTQPMFAISHDAGLNWS